MDNWKNRSQNMRCTTCMYYVPKVDDVAPQSTIGRCRRHAPEVQQGWPVVFPTDWCGDHKPNEAVPMQKCWVGDIKRAAAEASRSV